ncbi:MAG: hypothetical protein GY873_24400, partial [Bosea sp.]|uniref:hypothetical protein n=1 Tax=Bosea sp. (in: a-proteobacteria) TaxID=1871050 RepID=UPI002394DBB9|nr:hypothetical protein [Bosea sp. (in: a-proteobacteria)]
MSDMDSGSLVSYNINCSNVCFFGDRQLVSSLFQVANHGGDNADGRRGGDDNAGLDHWREVSRVAMSFDTAKKAEKTLSRYRERSGTRRGGSFDEGFLPSALDAEPHRSDDEESGIFVYGSDQRRAPSSGLIATQEMPPEDDRSA